ncbi:MAG: hypothetical protein R3250_16640, partial [Melioribacteraceae bacterium]|nr:hypothetical protein [Melioribacteraceae bacterium]
MKLTFSLRYKKSMTIKLLGYLSIIAIGAMFIGCDNTLNDEPLINEVPETSLFLFPDDNISQQKSRLHVHWWGDDSDGLIVGFIFKWEGIDSLWSFTTSNDSIFALPIGTVDTSYLFSVSAVDNSGNGHYDESVFLNGIEIMAEPYIDQNENGVYDEGEFFYDFGAIDETPAIQKFPIRNSAPEVGWNDISVLPERSFPTITVGWDASDLDGDETITQIHL